MQLFMRHGPRGALSQTLRASRRREPSSAQMGECMLSLLRRRMTPIYMQLHDNLLEARKATISRFAQGTRRVGHKRAMGVQAGTAHPPWRASEIARRGNLDTYS